ncbi:hypothetical protein GCM10023307_31320 [Lysobacter hankyongensis]|uniref:Uncharacterized protein n=1 Tax=Lysobacter hankyongensis TaxID=1176535 RepID=A0ABP9C1C7_9GAMM
MRLAGLIGLTVVCGLAQAGEPYLRVGVDYGTVFSSEKPKKNEPKGCLAGSVGRMTASKGGPSSVRIGIHFQGADAPRGTRKRMIELGWWQPMSGQPPEIREGDSVRDVFLICLRPGEYRLATFTFGYNTVTKYMGEHMVLPLRVEAGKTHYLGSFMLSDQGEIHPCSGEDRGLRMILQDRAEVDIPLINRFVEGEPAFADIPDVRGHEPLFYGCLPVPVR